MHSATSLLKNLNSVFLKWQCYKCYPQPRNTCYLLLCIKLLSPFHRVFIVLYSHHSTTLDWWVWKKKINKKQAWIAGPCFSCSFWSPFTCREVPFAVGLPQACPISAGQAWGFLASSGCQWEYQSDSEIQQLESHLSHT